MLSHRFDDALHLALRVHRDQVRKGTSIPYVSHLMAVAALVLEYGGDEDQAIAALLHDAVEDGGGLVMAERIAADFGSRVAATVLECSDSTGEPKAPWTERKTAYLAAISTKSDDAILVTTCDKLHNATAILCDLGQHGPSVFDRFSASQPEVLWYYGALANALSARSPGPLAQRLADTVATLCDRAADVSSSG